MAPNFPKINKDNVDALAGANTVLANGNNGFTNANNIGSWVQTQNKSTVFDVIIGTGQPVARRLG